ncbi:extracellular solute-binding protein [Rhizobium sp. CECT 9324]|jgi:microcin C transport system substrate-binding protein|uniref:extracellular solute-binding protein n=1 Tax=Rhizobium sp. CECT 9324 TaxID=2845820 RepID=UPI001E4583A1|nr:extracellular solute-binding protein [Rhizobium sp. CECT 9324]CAH0339011.1 Oligopeptide-binding protein AppA [Rhizobium sp. CECT 9324]
MALARRIAASVLGLLLCSPALGVQAQEPEWRHALAVIEAPKYPKDFERFSYVNPNAPKAGNINLSASGTFDSFNPVLDKGELAAGLAPRLSLVTETLLKPSMDEVDAVYGLLAEAVYYPEDYAYARFRLRPEAKWADGVPVTPEDVIFSFDKFKEFNPLYSTYYNHVVKAEKTGDREVTFTFDEKNNRELPVIVGELDIVPKHWWTANGPDGKSRDISRTTLEPILGSGPYKIAAFTPGAKIQYELRDDYWGKDLNVNIGYNNFKSQTYTYFADLDVEFEAFRSGSVDFWAENSAMRWARSYDFPAVADGRVKRQVLDNEYKTSGVLVGFVPNMRREMFKDARVRKALNYAFDFEELNRTIFFDQYKRIDSYFYGSELASKGLPEGKELEILKGLGSDVAPEVLTQEYKNPVGGDGAKLRDNLRQALALLKEAGYELRNGKMVLAATGAPLQFEILLNGPTIERVAIPFADNLRKIGIQANVRTVDSAQYANRVRSFDYDMIYLGWAQSLNPGNEQRDYWGSKSVDQPGSRNYAGISDPGIDKLINQIIFAKDRDTLIPTVKALDRVLLASNYTLPTYTLRSSRIAYWDKFDHAELPTYGIGFPSIWWSKSP